MKKSMIWVVIILWVLAGAQFVFQITAKDEKQIIEAFHDIDFSSSVCEIEAYGEYQKEYLTREEQKELLKRIASKLGIESGYQLEEKSKENGSEVFLYKKAKRAETTLKLMTAEVRATENFIESRQYLSIEILLYDSIDSGFHYKDAVTEILKEEGISTKTVLNLKGSYQGKLSLEKKNELTDQLLSKVEGKTVIENRTDELFTVYAYTSLIPEFIYHDKKKVNLTVAVTFDEITNETKLYLATPVLEGSY